MRLFKKIIPLALAVLSLIALAACTQKTETVTYQSFKQNSYDGRLTMEAEGDKVTRQTVKTVQLYSAAGISSADEAKEQAQANIDNMNKVEGVTVKADFGKDRLTVTVDVDLKKADLKELIQSGAMQVDDSNGADFISLKETKKALEKSGYKEVKDGKFQELKAASE